MAAAQGKLARKGCDWILANDVSAGVFGGGDNTVHVVTADGVENWPRQSKEAVGEALAARMAQFFEGGCSTSALSDPGVDKP